jgi:hypothetical protein
MREAAISVERRGVFGLIGRFGQIPVREGAAVAHDGAVGEALERIPQEFARPLAPKSHHLRFGVFPGVANVANDTPGHQDAIVWSAI